MAILERRDIGDTIVALRRTNDRYDPSYFVTVTRKGVTSIADNDFSVNRERIEALFKKTCEAVAAKLARDVLGLNIEGK